MPTFSHDLPTEAKHLGYKLLRTPIDGNLTGLVTSPNFVVTQTHFWGGRTTPCQRPACKACDANSPTRGHVYLSLLLRSTHEHILFECTTTAAVPLDLFRRANQTLRGCLLKAHRPKRVKNGKVEIFCQTHDLTDIRLPQAPDIPRALCVIWKLPPSAIQIAPESGTHPILVPDPAVVDAINNDHDSGNGDQQQDHVLPFDNVSKLKPEDLLKCLAKKPSGS